MEFSLLQKFGAALLISAWLVWGSHIVADILVPVPEAARVAEAPAAAPAAAQPAELPEEPQEIGPLLAAASVDAGARVYNRCTACHTVEQDGQHRVGPNLWNIVGAPKAAKDGFSYSAALAEMAGEWSYENLDHFLANPKGYVEGTKMSFAGLRKASDRAAVILYLRDHAENPPPLP